MKPLDTARLAPACATCRGRARCEVSGLRQEYPACRTPLRRTSLAALEQHLRWAAEHHGLGSPRLERFLQVLLERHRDDRERYSEILEPSISVDEGRGRGAQLFRLSYAFPGYRKEPAARDALLAMAAPFGASAATFARLLRAADDERVAHVLFGLSWASPQSYRVKLYFQLRDEAPEPARRAFAARTLSLSTDALPPGPVHLVAVDHGETGVVGARVYLARPALAAEALALGPLAGLAGPLRGALEIHRMSRPGELDPAPSDLDFGLAESDLSWDDVAPLLSASWSKVPPPPVPIGVRRLSGGAGGRVTAYFVIMVEEP